MYAFCITPSLFYNSCCFHFPRTESAMGALMMVTIVAVLWSRLRCWLSLIAIK